MIIKVDKEGKTVITSLCDIALKQQGLQSLQGVIDVLRSIELIEPDEGKAVKTLGDTKELSWTVNMKQGDTVNLSYEFDAPDISPELFLTGPLKIGSFEELRQWQIASDAVTQGNVCTTGIEGSASGTSATATALVVNTDFNPNPTNILVRVPVVLGSPRICNTFPITPSPNVSPLLSRSNCPLIDLSTGSSCCPPLPNLITPDSSGSLNLF